MLVTNPEAVSSKVINDYPGMYSSAYVLENTLLNSELPNYGLSGYNSAPKSFSSNHFVAFVCLNFLFFYILV